MTIFHRSQQDQATAMSACLRDAGLALEAATAEAAHDPELMKLLQDALRLVRSALLHVTDPPSR